MAQIPPIPDAPVQKGLLLNSSQALRQRLSTSQYAESQVLSTRRASPPVPPQIHRKPVPIRSHQEEMPQVQSLDPLRSARQQKPQVVPVERSLSPFRFASQQKPHAVPIERSMNPVGSASRMHASSSDITTEDAPIFIGVVGVTGSGKSSLINRVTGCDDVVVSDGLRSGTDHVSQASLQIGPTTVNLVDTPGFNDTGLNGLEDEDVYYQLIDWLKDFHNNGQKLSGLIYLHPINKKRQKGSDVRSLKIFKKLVGRDNFDNIVIGLTFNDLEDPKIAASRERTLRESPDFWADMVAAGATVTRIPSDKEGCISLIAKIAGKKRMILQAERELFDDNKCAAETSAMEEIQDYEELKIIRLKEEMQQSTQQILFKERIRLTNQLSAERAKVEQQLFEERQAKQVIEEELLMWKNACEKEREDAQAIKLQHDREKELRGQKAEQEKREKKAKEERDKREMVLKQIEVRKDIDHAKSQITKLIAYCESTFALWTAYTRSANYSKVQYYQIIDMTKGGNFYIGLHCSICYKVAPSDEPLLWYHPNSTDTNFVLGVCTSEQCLAVAKRLFDQLSWKPQWHFPLLTSIFQCKRLTRPPSSLVCTRCSTSKQISGFYLHCCKCNNDDFDLCLECWAIKELGCSKKYEHCLSIAFLWDHDARYQIQR